MSEYQVIARKWRPQKFTDVVGQSHVTQTLKNAIVSGRTAHAYLFVGSRGIGKTTLARIFAKALICEHPENGEPCCNCVNCRAIAEERSLDIIEIDAASRNSAAAMRQLVEETLTLPVSGRYKIYIIDEVHMLSNAAWNVLLKTVEEPPAHVKFIFATTEVHQVLPTILSRCQRFDLQPIPTRLIAERLKLICETEKIAIDIEAIGAIARAGKGGMRDAQSLLDQIIAFFADGTGKAVTADQVRSLFGLTDRRDLEELLRSLVANDPGAMVRMLNRQNRAGKNLETLFEDLLGLLRSIQVCQILRDPSSVLDDSDEIIDRNSRIAAAVPQETIRILLEILAPAGRNLHEALDKEIFLETLLLKAMHEAHAVRIEDVLARLNQLRTAGELKFLDQLPAATGQKAVFPEPLPPSRKTPENEPDLPAMPAVPEEDPLPEKEIPDEPEKSITEACEIKPSEEPTLPDSGLRQADADDFSETAAPAEEKSAGEKDFADPSERLAPVEHEKQRRSILAEDPEALKKAMTDREVAATAELFDAKAVDVHKTV